MDVAALRERTPGCRFGTYLNNAGAALMSQNVLDTVTGHLRREAEIGAYAAKAEAADRLEQVYRSAARLIGARRSEIALMENATRSWQAAFYSLRFGKGDHIITGQAEYGSNVLALEQVCRRTGAQVVVAPNDASGQIDVDALARLIGERTALIAITHVPTNCGVISPAERIGAIARAAGVPFLLDACQSVGQLPLDVDAIGCDFLSATGRKWLRGPRGVGFLYVRSSMLERMDPWVAEVQSAARTDAGGVDWMPGSQRFETFERSTAGELGLGAALDLALDLGIEAISCRTAGLAAYLRDRLAELPGVRTHDLGDRRCAIVTATVAGHESAAVAAALAGKGITVNTTQARGSQYDDAIRGLPAMVRISPHYYNTEEELDVTVTAIAQLVG